MPGSSLIFVVILAIWGAYLLQHWIRRRDHVATARSVDRFSEAMRVLDRRAAGVVPDVEQPVQRRSVLAPSRPAHTGDPAGRAVVAAPVAPPRTARPRPSRPAVAARRTARPAVARRRTARLAALLRLMILAAGLVALGVGVILPLVTAAPTWLTAAGAVALLLSLAVARASVARARRPRRQLRSRRRARPATRRPAAPRPATAPPVERPAGPRHDSRRRAAAVYDVENLSEPTGPAPLAQRQPPAVADGARPAAATAPAPGGIGAIWEPVPVPRPTYTLKARADRPSAASPTPDELPADGLAMALDVELEELPSLRLLG